jgi:hypothetical protein
MIKIEKIDLEPDPGDKADVEQRYSIFNSHRGYEDNEGLFAGFPRDSIVWYRASVSKEELLNNIYYIDYSYWNKLSNGTRLPKIAVVNIQENKEVSQRFQKEKVFPSIIIVGDSFKSNRFVILEGHLRTTVFAMNPDLVPNKLEVLVGISTDINNWECY